VFANGHQQLKANRSCSQHYRSWIIWKCPSVRFLDFQKVKLVEREKAEELFGTTDKPSALARKVRILPTTPALIRPSH